jgi:hypothetical protein
MPIVHQHPGNISDHVVQKGIGANIDNDAILVAIHIDKMHKSVGALGLAALGAEG